MSLYFFIGITMHIINFLATTEFPKEGYLVLGFIVLLIIFEISKRVRFYKTGYKQKTNLTYKKMKDDKGRLGEYDLYIKLVNIFGKENVFVNLYIPTSSFTNTEVDLLVLSQYGIFIFEMKNLGGEIYGDENTKDWYAVFNKSRKFNFYNPFMQNKTHATAVENYLKLNTAETIPIVVFADRSHLQHVSFTHPRRLIKLNMVNKYVRAYILEHKMIYTLEEMSELHTKLSVRMDMPDHVKQEHIDYIHRKRR